MEIRSIEAAECSSDYNATVSDKIDTDVINALYNCIND